MHATPCPQIPTCKLTTNQVTSTGILSLAVGRRYLRACLAIQEGASTGLSNMLNRTGDSPISSMSLGAFFEAIGISSKTSRVRWGIILLAVLAGNAALAMIVTLVVRLFFG